MKSKYKERAKEILLAHTDEYLTSTINAKMDSKILEAMCQLAEEVEMKLIVDLIRIEAVKLVTAQSKKASRFYCRFDLEDILKYKQKPGYLARQLHWAMEKDIRLIYEIYMTDLERYSKEYMENLKLKID